MKGLVQPQIRVQIGDHFQAQVDDQIQVADQVADQIQAQGDADLYQVAAEVFGYQVQVDLDWEM